MADKSKTTRPGVTRKQAIVLGALSAMLIAALYSSQDTGATTDSTSVTTDARAARRKAAAAPTVAATVRWPSVTLEQTLKHNPFAELEVPVEPPSQTTPETVTSTPPVPVTSEEEPEIDPVEENRRRKSEETLAQLQSHKVSMILRTGKKASAMIGGRLVHEGDIVDGVRIVSILPNGVLVESAPVD